ncbi:TPA: hypothetical protein RG754_001262 [Enterococcus faecalis]|nr:hypothetical protein D928_02090 [Enterococcus faecalis 20-SD-BW-06]EPI02027.1 hypothetical protein D919_01254 [Enterococcus faecalis 20-SD-BW-08]HDU8535669.1 hypothetical protein [Enterococcus faecalis]HDU8550304.1 hypothetical protein [Enterococcus faecalis]
MAYRPRYLDKKRNKHFILSAEIKNNKLIVEYSNGEYLVIDSKSYTFFDSNGKFKILYI